MFHRGVLLSDATSVIVQVMLSFYEKRRSGYTGSSGEWSLPPSLRAACAAELTPSAGELTPSDGELTPSTGELTPSAGETRSCALHIGSTGSSLDCLRGGRRSS
eukprot:3871503-Pyramimonas_sp.AAC.1